MPRPAAIRRRLLVPAIVVLGAVAPLASPGTAAAVEPVGTARPLGSVVGSAPEPCLDGYACTGITVVDCPEVPGPLSGTYAVARPAGEPRGVAVFLSGSGGLDWFGVSGTAVNAAGMAMRDLVDAGLVVVQLRWSSPGWITSPAGSTVGADALACRPATALRHLHDTLYAPLGLAGTTGQCGFCVVGVSGGASAIAYAVTAYGLSDAVDVAVLGSGPPHASIAKGCMGEPGYTYTSGNRANIDRSYGFTGRLAAGWCQQADASRTEAWAADSVEVAGSDYRLDTTRVEFVFGSDDDPIIWAHARDLARVLVESGSPMVAERTVAAGHALYNSNAAVQAITDHLLRADQPQPAGPVVTVDSPRAGSVHEVGAHVTAAYSCAPVDGGAPVVSCAGPVASGALVDTSTPGTHQFTVQAVDEAGRTTTSSVAYEVRRAGPSVLLVVGRAATPTVADVAVRDRLVEALGATVTVRDDGARDDVAGYDAVVVSDSVDAEVLQGRYQRAGIGLVALDAGSWEDLGLASRSGSTSPGTALVVEQVTHPLAGAARATERSLTVTSATSAIAWVEADRLGRGAAQVMTLAKAPTRVVVAGYAGGAPLAGGSVAPAPRVALGYTSAAVVRLTADGWAVFDDAVTWALA